MVLPTDAVPLVRTAALRAFGDALNPSRTIHKTLGTKERQSLLVIIAALADAAKIPLTDAAAATKVSSLVDQLGCRMDVKTIATHLKGIPEALEARKP
jgi:hypothetical protein